MQQVKLDLTKPEQNIEVSSNTRFTASYIGRGVSNLACKLNFVHNLPGKKSDIHIKAVLYDSAKLDIRGNLVINRGAKQTDSYLKIDVLLVSQTAKAVAIPGLEIMEDEVKGGHGATVGTIDSEQLFYLTSRGLNEAEAIEILVEGFLHPS